jgi:hypothetical protein
MSEAGREREVGSTGFAAGFTAGAPMDRYLADPAVSASLLWKLHDETPAHVLDYLRLPEPPSSDAQELGNVVHTAVFEPLEFDDRYVILGQCAGRKKDGDRCAYQGGIYRDGESYCKTHDPYKGAPEAEGIYTVAGPLKDAALRMKTALLAHPTAGELLRSPGPREVVGCWQDPVTGLWCRIRPDLLLEDDPGVRPEFQWADVNLKTTAWPAKPGRYPGKDEQRCKTAFKAAFYRTGLRELWDVEPQWTFHAVVESTGGHQVAVHRINHMAMTIAEGWVREALGTLARCVESGRWPGYGAEIHDVNLSEWRLKQVHDIDFIMGAA